MNKHLSLLAAALILTGASASVSADYQFHQRIRGLGPTQVEAPRGPCTDPRQAQIGEISDNFCGGNGSESLVYAGQIDGRAMLYGMSDDSASQWWGYVDNWADDPAMINCIDGGTIANSCLKLADGKANTAQMLAFPQHSLHAAQTCASKGEGWFLPSVAELTLLWKNRSQIDTSQVVFTQTYYQTSNEKEMSQGWLVHMGTGLNTWGNKNDPRPVRCAKSYY